MRSPGYQSHLAGARSNVFCGSGFAGLVAAASPRASSASSSGLSKEVPPRTPAVCRRTASRKLICHGAILLAFAFQEVFQKVSPVPFLCRQIELPLHTGTMPQNAQHPSNPARRLSPMGDARISRMSLKIVPEEYQESTKRVPKTNTVLSGWTGCSWHRSWSAPVSLSAILGSSLALAGPQSFDHILEPVGGLPAAALVPGHPSTTLVGRREQRPFPGAAGPGRREKPRNLSDSRPVAAPTAPAAHRHR